MVIAVGTFAAILGLIVVPYWLFVVRSEQDETRKLRKRMKVTVAKGPARIDLVQSEQPLSNVPVVATLLENIGFVTEPLRRKILQAGLDVTVGVVLLGVLFCAFLAFAVVYYVMGRALVALPFALVAAGIPVVVVRFMASRRVSKFEEQFPEATELLARSLRAGHAFTTGLSMVAEELPDPVGAEFRLVYDRQAFGMPISDALRDMAQRVPLLDARFFVTAVLTQRESGGNLAEVLDNLARLMRERFTVRREVKTLSAHGRITGLVLVCLTPALAAILFFLAPAHMMLLISDPMGRFMVGACVVLQVIGGLAIRRIINIEI
jgi:tight adherence protein B